MNEIALANFYRVLNQADRFPTEKELADAAIAAKDELNSLRRASQESSPDANRQEPVGPPEIPYTLAPVYRFLMERCHYWQPIIDDESMPPVGWKGVVEAETKRGHIEYRQAEYKAPLFGGPATWAAWTYREEGDWKPLRWLKKWDLSIGERIAPSAPTQDTIMAAAREITETHLFVGRAVTSQEQIEEQSISDIIRKHLGERQGEK